MANSWILWKVWVRKHRCRIGSGRRVEGRLLGVDKKLKIGVFVSNMPTKSFRYLSPEAHYFDSACQNLRPQTVIQQSLEYYTQNNACGGRVNYEWGLAVDAKLTEVRRKVLDYVGKSSETYTVAFGPNTTYFINFLLQNLADEECDSVLTTHKEHNSVALPVQVFAKRRNKKLGLLSRDPGSGAILDYKSRDYPRPLLVTGTVSNIDGLDTPNLGEVVRLVKQADGLVILDACQELAHNRIDYLDVDFDALCFSGHKMYAPSLGVVVIKKSLIQKLDQVWVGGGVVEKADLKSYELISIDRELFSRLELGLIDYEAVFGLGEALGWLKEFKIAREYPAINYRPTPLERLQDRLRTGASRQVVYYIDSLAELLYVNLLKLSESKQIFLLNSKPSSIMSFVPMKMDSYELTKLLSKQGVMCRSGFMCAHGYIQEVLKLPAITRISLGLHNTPQDVVKLLAVLEEVLF